jgi:hypothetical protein
MAAMPGIGLVHLVWVPCGLEPLRRFLRSYAENPAGIEHELLILINGFHSEGDLAGHLALLQDVRHRTLLVEKRHYDIQSYLLAARRFDLEYLCFVNSYSTILAGGWLAKLYRRLTEGGVGLVGATGSWESPYSNLLGPEVTDRSKPLYKRFGLLALRALNEHYFDPFPNYHLRTNGFLIRRDLLRRLHCETILGKWHTYRFESGKGSMTNQVLGLKQKVLVVDKHGRGYEPPDWYKSYTFRQGAQEDLLIADNRTEEYLHADPEKRVMLSRLAWGDRADPLEDRRWRPIGSAAKPRPPAKKTIF